MKSKRSKRPLPDRVERPIIGPSVPPGYPGRSRRSAHSFKKESLKNQWKYMRKLWSHVPDDIRRKRPSNHARYGYKKYASISSGNQITRSVVTSMVMMFDRLLSSTTLEQYRVHRTLIRKGIFWNNRTNRPVLSKIRCLLTRGLYPLMLAVLSTSLAA